MNRKGTRSSSRRSPDKTGEVRRSSRHRGLHNQKDFDSLKENDKNAEETHENNVDMKEAINDSQTNNSTNLSTLNDEMSCPTIVSDGEEGKGKSKNTCKSNLEKDFDVHPNSDVSANAQVTTQSLNESVVNDRQSNDVENNSNAQDGQEKSAESLNENNDDTNTKEGIKETAQNESVELQNEETVNETNVTNNRENNDNHDSENPRNGFNGDDSKNNDSNYEEEEGEIREVSIKNDEAGQKYDAQRQEKLSNGPTVKIVLRRDSNEPVPETEPINKDWSSVASNTSSQLFKIKIEDIKSVCPTLALLEEKDVKLESLQRRRSTFDKERKSSAEKERTKSPEFGSQISINSSLDDSDRSITTNIIAMNRKISIVEDMASKLKPPPSPAKNPTSAVLYITNLVRPFTVKQLAELLERTGKIKEGGFWTDRIKSKCFAHYETVEEAEATRNALHGVNWPVGNGKKLIIEYSTPEEMESMIKPIVPSVPVVTSPPSIPQPKTPILEIKKEVREVTREVKQDEHVERKHRERRKESTREWDIGKERHQEKEKSRSRDRKKKRSRRSRSRSYTPIEEYIAKKQKKHEDAVPQKLMDDLFLKTKTMPSIYWQPLSPEEIALKQQQRLVRMEEHKRRLEEKTHASSRGGVREGGGGRGAAFNRRR